MANAARVHAIESGKTYEGRTLIAFGGGGPVHACRLAEKVGIKRVLVPSGAGVGSAIGFLRAPVGYEVVRSLYQRLSTFDLDAVNALLISMFDEANAVVEQGRLGASITETRIAFMRYVGQGHEIPVLLPTRTLSAADVPAIHAAYEQEYAKFFDRPVPGSDVEVMSFAVVLTTAIPPVATVAPVTDFTTPNRPDRNSFAIRHLEQPPRGLFMTAQLWYAGARVSGPAIISEDETSTLVSPGWQAFVNNLRYLEIVRETD